ncbi:hypothetical protein [Kitasatospora cheerisanensis]|uniref:Uncharacterized protein n=1 Tax=Kitasatospora cheerisanensis KCTC 2395 TaxID=1348663 RepID=A0A066YS11_9ACTN|nr:hypothetical protein [Kitasatospora cheerisanensis]KDN80675.1 hypothetical protein KCH_75930 [Kitasatospora cheerisanensis KCTC 2395]
MADLQVDAQALELTAKGINDSIKELESVGFAEGAGAGRGFSLLELTGLEIGDQGCRSAFEDFCERWALVVRELVQEGNEIAERLNLSAGLYHEQEKYLSDSLKLVVNSAMGNPNLTGEQVTAQSWRQTLSDNTVSQIANADFSAQSFQAAAVHQQASWEGLKADFDRNSGAARVFGPDEEAAKAAEARQSELNRQYEQMTGGK